MARYSSVTARLALDPITLLNRVPCDLRRETTWNVQQKNGNPCWAFWAGKTPENMLHVNLCGSKDGR